MGGVGWGVSVSVSVGAKGVCGGSGCGRKSVVVARGRCVSLIDRHQQPPHQALHLLLHFRPSLPPHTHAPTHPPNTQVSAAVGSAAPDGALSLPGAVGVSAAAAARPGRRCLSTCRGGGAAVPRCKQVGGWVCMCDPIQLAMSNSESVCCMRPRCCRGLQVG